MNDICDNLKVARLNNISSYLDRPTKVKKNLSANFMIILEQASICYLIHELLEPVFSYR